MGGSGGGGGGYIGPITPSLQQKIQNAQDRERTQFIGDINNLLSDYLVSFNGRDRTATNDKLEKLQDLLGKEVEIEKVLFGGSVAKHTEVDGLSDIDALVILNKEDLEGKAPAEVLEIFYKILYDKMDWGSIRDQGIKKGRLAVTVEYKEGEEIQLLPAIKTKTSIAIASANGQEWNQTKPKEFQKKMSDANEKVNNCLIPVIKLTKSINANLPIQKQLTGYHIEAIAVNIVSSYDGDKTARSLLLHLLGAISQSVLTPIKDTTGQSPVVDAYLGEANSIKRQNISQAFSGLQRRLDTATSIQQWKSVFGE